MKKYSTNLLLKEKHYLVGSDIFSSLPPTAKPINNLSVKAFSMLMDLNRISEQQSTAVFKALKCLPWTVLRVGGGGALKERACECASLSACLSRSLLIAPYISPYGTIGLSRLATVALAPCGCRQTQVCGGNTEALTPRHTAQPSRSSRLSDLLMWAPRYSVLNELG